MKAVKSLLDKDLILLDIKFDYNIDETPLRTHYNEFLSEAFEFYDTNAKIWKDYVHDPLYYLLEDKDFHHFTIPIREAVVTAAYLYRREYHRYFDVEIRRLRYIDAFLPSDFCYSVRDSGFIDLFYWIAHLFELKLFCKIREVDFEEICNKRFANHLGFSSYKASALLGLENACEGLNYFYFPLIEVFHGNFPSCDIRLPFNHAVRIVNREFKYDHMWMHFAVFHNSAAKKCKSILCKKFISLSSYIPNGIVLGYRSGNKIIPQDESKAFSEESSETYKNLHFAAATQDCTEVSLNASSRKFNPTEKSPKGLDDTKSFFAFSCRYKGKSLLASFASNEPEYKRYIKLYSAAKGKMELVEGLMNVLDENMEKNNLYEITDEVFAVQPPNSDINIGDKIIILDTSSDDEDECFDHSQLVFMSRFRPALKYWKYCIAGKDKILKEVYGLREKLKYNAKCKTQSNEEKEVTTKSKGAIQKEIESTEQNLGINKKQKRARKKRGQEIISVENTKSESSEAKSVDPNLKITKITALPENTTEEISMKNAGAKRDCIKQTLESRTESQECITENTQLELNLHKTKLEDRIRAKSVSANIQQEEISLYHTS